ncbi:MAG: alpha/beta hydrolase-fold protein [Ferruginibacter sp.]
MKHKPLQRIIDKGHKASLLTAAFILCAFVASSQFTARFLVSGIPATHVPDSLFVAGSFNGWNAAKNGTLMSKQGDTATIVLTGLPGGKYEFKVTRGSWQSVECHANGNDAGNRLFNLSADTVMQISVAAWKDDFAAFAKKHTASANVRIIDTAFAMPQLERTRRIWLYLPPGYANNRKRYPVLYMHDGQNIFDEYTSSNGEWKVDECIDSLVKIGKPGCIVVGIDNGPKRLNEYNPYDFAEFGKGEGNEYVDFIVKNLKPFIDRRYRTLAGPQNTMIAGSSMGGLISYYAMLKYPEVFGKGGIFSPAFWTAEKIRDMTDSCGKKLKGKLFFYIGEKEGENYSSDMKEVTDRLGTISSALIYAVTDSQGSHNEEAWRKWFPEFYNWVLAKGFNNVISVEMD